MRPAAEVSPTRWTYTVERVTRRASIGPVKRIEIRGSRSNPSSWSTSRISSQSDGRAVQSGCGSAIRRPVTWLASATVARSDGLITRGAGAGGSQATNAAVTRAAVTANTPQP